VRLSRVLVVSTPKQFRSNRRSRINLVEGGRWLVFAEIAAAAGPKEKGYPQLPPVLRTLAVPAPGVQTGEAL
jgi:hypothetical protein